MPLDIKVKIKPATSTHKVGPKKIQGSIRGKGEQPISQDVGEG